MAASGARKPAGNAVIAAVAIGAALLTFQVVRNAAAADRERLPALAQALWPSHPSVMTDEALLDIATNAARGAAPPANIGKEVRRIAARAPLSPDPFVIRAAMAQTEARDKQAEALLTEARFRDPRSRAARFLLAERYFRTGRMTDGLIEMQALVGLQSQGLDVFVPALVAYARTPGAVPQLQSFFRRRPQTEASVLAVLAGDPANADLVLALATDSRNPQPDWRAPLLSGLTNEGQFARAYAIWLRLSGIGSTAGLYNPDFAKTAAPPPFNWAYAGTPEGIAEADGKGGLHILFYGRATATLASQVMILRAGSYRLAMKVDAGDGDPSAVRATVRCLPGDKPVAELPMRRGTAAAAFALPDACQAARLDFGGVAGDVPETTELTVSGLRLDPAARP